jgi:predicted acyl esterase
LFAAFLLIIIILSGCENSGSTVEVRLQTDNTKRSSFGVYSGYSEPRFNSFVRQSVYVPVSDGTRIAMDIYRPALDGELAQEPLPVALMVTRYWRAREMGDGSIKSLLGRIDGQTQSGLLLKPDEIEGQDFPLMGHLLARHGYIVMAMDSRGTGASFGVQSPGLAIEIQDMRDVMDWIDHQAWSTGKVGMFGWSWPGIIQIFAATGSPPQLAAIFPAVPNFSDWYRIFVAGGVYRKAAALTMRRSLVNLSEVKDAGQVNEVAKAVDPVRQIVGVARVDEDIDGSLRLASRAQQGEASFAGYIEPVLAHPEIQKVIQRLGLESVDSQIEILFYADALDKALEGHPDLRASLVAAEASQTLESAEAGYNFLEKFRASSVPAYFWDGWQDPAPSERLLYFYNLDQPGKLTIGPWSHGPNEPDDPRESAHIQLAELEMLRWFDYWLKDIDNGILQEPKINYAVARDKSRWQWRTASTFPPLDSTEVDFFFAGGESGSIQSVNDGLLTLQMPAANPQSDEYTADYSLQVGPRTRNHDATGGGPIKYDDLAPNDAKALTYTTAPLESDLSIAGFPILSFFVSSTAQKLNFILYLEEVDPSGKSSLVTQGAIRSSHRAIKSPLYETNGIPWTSSLQEDIDNTAPLTEGPAEIRFALEPVAKLFAAGNRIRVTIANADENLILTFPDKPRPVTSVWRDAAHPSRLTLHVLPDS